MKMGGVILLSALKAFISTLWMTFLLPLKESDGETRIDSAR
jgi:hypothetical protein